MYTGAGTDYTGNCLGTRAGSIGVVRSGGRQTTLESIKNESLEVIPRTGSQLWI